jgi:cell division protein FtsW
MPQAVKALQATPLGAAARERPASQPRYDLWLLGVAACIVGLGLIMVASASISIADRDNQNSLYFFWRQLAALGIVVVLGCLVLQVPLRMWQRASTLFLFGGVALLVAVLLPGLGREVNGSMRWIPVGPVSLQASEPVKVCFIIYLSAYMVRHAEQVRRDFVGFIKPVGVLIAVSALLLLEPDYGAVVVLFTTALGMLFMGGVPLLRFVLWGLAAVATLSTLAIIAPYRLQRLMTFMDPWSDPYNTGFQLTQALIAFGRGEWFGVGLGNSIQKLFYLPEVHTDFVFAVVGEELGFVGTLSVILLFTFLVWRVFYIAGSAERAGKLFAAYLAYGIGLLIGVEAFANIGVNMGLLPTKGLTLPLMSYGSNSVIVTGIALVLVLRVALETRTDRVEAGRDRE